jgi:hypothetical protein
MIAINDKTTYPPTIHEGSNCIVLWVGKEKIQSKILSNKPPRPTKCKNITKG